VAHFLLGKPRQFSATPHYGRQRAYRQATKALVPLSEDIETASLMIEEGSSSIRAIASSTLSGTVEELCSMSANK
jgi:hypothetical protein